MDFTKEDLVILIALVGQSTDVKKIKKVKQALFLEKNDIKNTIDHLKAKETYDLGYELYKRLLNEYNKLR